MSGVIPTEDAFKRIRRATKHFEQSYINPGLKGEKVVRTRGGSSSWTIHFEICETCCVKCFAIATILYKNQNGTPPGKGATITGCDEMERELESHQIQIWDKWGCFLNVADEDFLVGRKGEAKWMIPDHVSCDGVTEYEEECAGVPLPGGNPTEPLWVITSMAGPTLCEVEA